MEQRVDHGILEVGAPTPGHKRVWPPAPALLSQVGSHRLRQAFLHVHHRAVLVEHAHLNLCLECFQCHLFQSTPEKIKLPNQTESFRVENLTSFPDAERLPSPAVELERTPRVSGRARTRGSRPTSQAFICSARYLE